MGIRRVISTEKKNMLFTVFITFFDGPSKEM